MVLNSDSEKLILCCTLIKTTKRITFQIDFQEDDVTNKDLNSIKSFKSSNGYDVISEHRMDIQSRRIWLLGAENDQSSIRSGTMHTPTKELCDESFSGFIQALEEWAVANDGQVYVNHHDFTV